MKSLALAVIFGCCILLLWWQGRQLREAPVNAHTSSHSQPATAGREQDTPAESARRRAHQPLSQQELAIAEANEANARAPHFRLTLVSNLEDAVVFQVTDYSNAFLTCYRSPASGRPGPWDGIWDGMVSLPTNTVYDVHRFDSASNIWTLLTTAAPVGNGMVGVHIQGVTNLAQEDLTFTPRGPAVYDATGRMIWLPPPRQTY